jgi:Ni/Co efflux regulator RcnB
MKNVMLALLAIALCIPVIASAQDNGKNSDNQAKQSNQSNQKQSSQNMSAKVSHDGKAVTDNKDNKTYKVNNPETLKDYENQPVALVVQVDPDNNVIHIISVAPPQQ